MPSTPRKNAKGYYIELPPDLVAEFDSLAVKTGRTRTVEIVRAMRRHLANPEPHIPPILIEPPQDPPTPPKKRGRPRKPQP